MVCTEHLIRHLPGGEAEQHLLPCVKRSGIRPKVQHIGPGGGVFQHHQPCPVLGQAGVFQPHIGAGHRQALQHTGQLPQLGQLAVGQQALLGAKIVMGLLAHRLPPFPVGHGLHLGVDHRDPKPQQQAGDQPLPGPAQPAAGRRRELELPHQRGPPGRPHHRQPGRCVQAQPQQGRRQHGPPRQHHGKRHWPGKDHGPQSNPDHRPGQGQAQHHGRHCQQQRLPQAQGCPLAPGHSQAAQGGKAPHLFRQLHHLDAEHRRQGGKTHDPRQTRVGRGGAGRIGLVVDAGGFFQAQIFIQLAHSLVPPARVHGHKILTHRLCGPGFSLQDRASGSATARLTSSWPVGWPVAFLVKTQRSV